mmetsp:Transcript_32140/g.88817  ORF Transcript_32140/g.88817 Transcript_32140/m.88817 type:complete len:209 (-) Transcript_32140:166-792(-)
MPRGVLEPCTQHLVLRDELVYAGLHHELHGFPTRVRLAPRHALKSLLLVQGVAEGDDVAALCGSSGVSVDGVHHVFKCEAFPGCGRAASVPLVGARGDDVKLLDRREEGRHEFRAAPFDPALRGVCHDDDAAEAHRGGDGRAGVGRDELELLELLPVWDAVVRGAKETLSLEPSRREQRVVPVEDEQRLSRGEGCRQGAGADECILDV